MAFKYVSGAPVKNAVGYALYEKNSDGSLTEIDRKEARQYFPYAGAITVSGSTAKPTEIGTELVFGGKTVESGSRANVFPISKATVEGYKYYVEVSGLMDINMEDGSAATAVSFRGVYDGITSPEAVEFGFYDGTTAPLREENGVFYFKSNLGEIKVFQSTGDVAVRGVRLTPNTDGNQTITVTSANDRYKHTDFIEVAALEDSIAVNTDETDPNKFQLYCVGKLEAIKDPTTCVIAFYTAMNYSTCVDTRTYAELVDAFGTGAKPYLKKAYVQTLAKTATEKGKGEAKYVIFTSSDRTGGKDQVGVGIYFPIYGQYTELADPSPDNLVVKALGDGLIYADSPESNVVTYTG